MQESEIKQHIDGCDVEGMKSLIKSERFTDKDYKFALGYSASVPNAEFFELILDNYFYSPIELRYMRLGNDENSTILKFLVETGNLQCLTILLATQKQLSVKSKRLQARLPELSLESGEDKVDLDYLLPAELGWALNLFMEDKLPCLPEILKNPKQAAVFHIVLEEALKSDNFDLLFKLKELGLPEVLKNPKLAAVFQGILDKAVESGNLDLLLTLKEHVVPFTLSNPHLVHVALHMEKDAPGITEVVLSASKVQYANLRFPKGNSIVHHCLNEGFYSLLSYLLSRIRVDNNLALLEVKNNDNLTPLALACSQHDMKALHFFQLRASFESPEVLAYVNTVRDGKSLAWHIITSCLANDAFLLLIIDVLDVNYRDPEGKSYLQLLCEQKYFAEKGICALVNKHPSLIDTLTPFALNRCLKREDSGLAQDIVFLIPSLPPKIELSEELRSCDTLKKSVLKCCKPWNFIKLLQVMQANIEHPRLERLLEILSVETSHLQYPRTEYQRATLAAMVTDESDDADFQAKKSGITADLLVYMKTPNLNASRVDGFLMAIVSSRNMEQLNACIRDQVQIHNGVKLQLPAHEESCPEHLKPMRYPNLKNRYWTLITKWEQPQEALGAHPN